jgi:hypothetical protein
MFTKSIAAFGFAAFIMGLSAPAYADSCNVQVRGDNNSVNCTIVKSRSDDDDGDEDRRPVRRYRSTSDYGYVTDYAPTYAPSYGPAYYGPAYAYRPAYAYAGYGPGFYNAGPRMMMGGRFGFRR